MKRTRRRVVAALALVSATSLVASACSSGSEGGEGGEEEATLRIFVHANPPTDAGFEAINAMFEEQHPGVTVELTTAQGADFFTVRNTRLTAENVDITEGSSSGGTRLLPDWVQDQTESDWVVGLQAGTWVDLTDQPFLDNFSPEIMEAYEYEGRSYAVPTGTSLVGGVYYNTALFEEHGLELPTTWDELLHVIDVFEAAGVAPFIMGGKDVWPAGAPMYGLVQSLFPDSAALDQGLWEGDVQLTDPEVVTLMERLATIYAHTYPQWEGIDYSSVPARFAAGDAAMMPDGGWSIPAIQEADPDFEFGYFPLPGSDNAADNDTIAGKLEFSLSIPTSSDNQELAMEWLALYSDPEVYSDFIVASGFGTAQPDVELGPVLQGVQQYLPEGGFTPSWDQVFHGNRYAGPLAANPFAFDNVAPVGTYTDMAELTARMNDDWQVGLDSLP
ncbi:extracellular solute-binding protein family 1 [Beutenbergia cavernae DSM 12333]|uniref:Extracellular solute-binding protein family 1 n=1 Tax=Beutenbergia cavernae (strain ATCC BAA-8 / DSM 12333 / CCUG 43141 / JCM 11478 / NBRC 16432 / NCIMB 13614 / HKI 0122) TaxID=471853 RepID=C5BX22_BEUC1|nr:extracellular solute-binding protein [Beutenbergia cavernae]ACQ78697.1 extracellular solute-binding protein family 1 [Beutenbergia cavernae DSM 12333]